MNIKMTSFLLGKLNKKYIVLAMIFFVANLFVFTNLCIGFDEVNIAVRRECEILLKFKNSDEIIKIELADDNIDEIIDFYNSQDEVDFAEPNYIYDASIIPSDTFFNNQWYLQKIKAVRAWNEIYDSKEIVVAIVDTGVQIDHPDLKDNIWINNGEISKNGIDDDGNGFIDDVNGWDFVLNTNNPSPKFDKSFSQENVLHGTIVAGIAAGSGNNASGVTGVTWGARIMPLRVLDGNGKGDTRSVIKAIDYAIANKANIINFSFAGFGYSRGLDMAIRRAYRAGIVMVAAAGNDNDRKGYSLDETPVYPVCNDGNQGENMIIGVAATDELDQKTDFSGYGFRCIDITAPGVSIFSTSVYKEGDKNYNSYYDGYWSGTSMAVPMVSATIALMETVNPGLSRDEIVESLFEGADNISKLNPKFLGQLGKGRLNVERSVMLSKFNLYDKSAGLFISPASDAISMVGFIDKKNELLSSFMAYNKFFKGGVDLASGDVDGDGEEEIVVGAGPGGGPHIKIFSKEGELKYQFFAFNSFFRGGVSVGVGDVDGDDIDEIVVGAGPGGGPHVRVFNPQGELKGQFFAYGENFRGGVNVAVGDIDGDNRADIVTGAGDGGGPHVRVFTPSGVVKSQFFAYNKNFRGGVNVAVANTNGVAQKPGFEIVTSVVARGVPRIKIFSGDGEILNHFLAHDRSFRGGINLSILDYDRDGYDEIVTGQGAGGESLVKIFESDGEELYSFFAFEEEFKGGVNVAGINY